MQVEASTLRQGGQGEGLMGKVDTGVAGSGHFIRDRQAHLEADSLTHLGVSSFFTIAN